MSIKKLTLSGKITSKRTLQERAYKEGIPYTRLQVVTVFVQEEGAPLSKRVEALRKLALPNSYVLSFNGHVIILTGEQPTPFTIISMLNALKQEMSDEAYSNMWMGISRSCLNVSELARGYNEALEVTKVADLLGEATGGPSRILTARNASIH